MKCSVNVMSVNERNAHKWNEYSETGNRTNEGMKYECRNEREGAMKASAVMKVTWS